LTCEALFFERLRARGLRLTPQREMILVELHQPGEPVTAEEIYDRVAIHSTSLERSTVYRTLDLLTSLGMVTSIDRGDRIRRYELVDMVEPHIHLVCRHCGKVIGMTVERLQPFLDAVQADDLFTPDLANMTIPGLCRDCSGQGF
jgi:Fur family transcriptional regulator, ferric uptake regulator